MKENLEKCVEIAERMYDLDTEVYECVGSSLGRVFASDRRTCAENLVNIMAEQPQGHLLRSELAMISNMARTIRNKEDKSRLMREYDAILKEIATLPTSFGKVDIVNEKRARLNTSNLHQKFKKDDHMVICIGRTQGSAGNDIGFALADALKINYYDVEIFSEVLKRLEVEREEAYGIHDHDNHKHVVMDNKYQKGFDASHGIRQRFKEFNRYHGLTKADAIFFNQSDLLCQKAKEEDFIVMGRCADVILANNHIPHVSIFITAPFEQRVRRIMEVQGITYKQAARQLKRLDKKHERYFRYYTGLEWGAAENYDICFNSASYGIEESVEIIDRMLHKHLQPDS